MSTVPEMIKAKNLPSGVEKPLPAQWQQELAAAIRSSDELLALLELDSVEDHCSAAKRASFPLFVPRGFVNRMRVGDRNDPLLRQVLPDSRESAHIPGFVADAVGDLMSRRAPGMLQKYQGRALLIAAGACAIHCRYCFRREYPYENDPGAIDDWEPAIRELESDSSLTEVILSGGDPLMLTDVRLSALCERLSAIPRLERIRFHSRLPIVLPARITPALLDLLADVRPQVLFVVHANHAQEIDETCAAALRKLIRTGIPVLNQAVLLRGINDEVDVLEKLCRRLINLGVLPYYLHQLDRVNGTAHFEVDEQHGRRLMAELATRLPGYAVPRYVREVPGEPHKIIL